MTDETRQLAAETDETARELLVKEHRRSGTSREKARRLRKIAERLADDFRTLAELEDRIEYLERNRAIRQKTRPSRNGQGRR